jgi:hypothetical protein
VAKEKVRQIDAGFQNGGDGKLRIVGIILTVVLVLVVIATIALFVIAPSLILE